MISLLIAAAGTDTVLVAYAPSSKAFTIQFQTVDFSTFTALMVAVTLFLLFLSVSHHVAYTVHAGQGLECPCWHSWRAVFVQ